MIKLSIKPDADLGRVIRRLGDDFENAIPYGLTFLVEDVEAAASDEAPKQTRNLVNAITSFVTKGGRQGVVRVTDAAPYAIFVHEGTGLYGPRKQKIVIEPTEKKALFWPGARHPVRRVVQLGQKPNPFMARGVATVKGAQSFREGLMAYLKRKGHGG